jgi:preprotein translocase subunit SecA
MIRDEVAKLTAFHIASDRSDEWDLEEIAEDANAITNLGGDLRADLERIAAERTSVALRRVAIETFLSGRLEQIFEERRKTAGESAAQILKAVALQSIDILWMDHLDQMEHLRDSVRLRAYGQRDPLVEYKGEGARLFRELQAAIRAQIVNTLFKVQIGAAQTNRAPVPTPLQAPKLVLQGAAGDQPAQNRAAAPPPGKGAKRQEIGRNDPCPCGSGKKYKKCHGA